MDGHVRVLKRRVETRAVRRCRLRRERARHEDEHEREEGTDEPQHRNGPGEQVTCDATRPQDCGCAVRAEDEQPEEQRSLLSAPERCQRVAERQRLARVLRDVREGEIVPCERDQQHGGCRDRRAEGGEQRVLGGGGEPTSSFPRRERACHGRVREQSERGDERRATEISH